jgi:hypothetical protein
MNILVLIPLKPNLLPFFRNRIGDLAAGLLTHNPNHQLEIVFDERGDGDASVSGLKQRSTRLAVLRQSMVNDHLKDHDAVLWIDADIIEFPLELPTLLLERSGGGIAAPVVVQEVDTTRFYDIGGFVENGNWAREAWPWFEQNGPVYELNGVGACYLVPAVVYKSGGRHVPIDGYTEHYSICIKARSMGLPVRAFADLLAVHAFLPKYGEEIH